LKKKKRGGIKLARRRCPKGKILEVDEANRRTQNNIKTVNRFRERNFNNRTENAQEKEARRKKRRGIDCPLQQKPLPLKKGKHAGGGRLSNPWGRGVHRLANWKT